MVVTTLSSFNIYEVELSFRDLYIYSLLPLKNEKKSVDLDLPFEIFEILIIFDG
jgi:hypothetical protein